MWSFPNSQNLQRRASRSAGKWFLGLVALVVAVGGASAAQGSAPGAGIAAGVVEQAVALAQAHRAVRNAPPNVPLDAYLAAARGERTTGLEVVANHPARRAWGVTRIDAPIGKVWSALNDFSVRPDLTAVSFSEVQSGGRCASGRKVFQYLPISIPFVGDRWWLVTLTSNRLLWERTGGRVRELVSVSDNNPSLLTSDRARELAAAATPVAFSRGGWMLVDVDGSRTLAEFYVWSDPGGSIPAGIMSAFAQGSVVDNLKALTELVRLGGTCPEQ